jgi:hypothetical protein
MDNYNEMEILFYFGGFAPVGGIETFSKNLLGYLQSKHHNCTLLCWGEKSPLLESIKLYFTYELIALYHVISK